MKAEPQCPTARGIRIVKQLINGEENETILFEEYDDEVYYGIGKQLGELVIDGVLDAGDVHEIIHTHPNGDVVQTGFDERKYEFGAEKSKQTRNDECSVDEASALIELLFTDEQPAWKGYDEQRTVHIGFDLAEQVIENKMSVDEAITISEGYDHPDSAINGFQRKVESIARVLGSVVGCEYDEFDSRVEFVRDQLFNQLFASTDSAELETFKQAWDDRFQSSFKRPNESYSAEDVPSNVSLQL